jgi:hypothetical protein
MKKLRGCAGVWPDADARLHPEPLLILNPLRAEDHGGAKPA